MKKIGYIVIICILFLSCHKDSDITNITVSGPIPIVKVESSVTGRVISETGFPISNATVIIAGNTLTTNDKGQFFLSNALLNKNGEHIRVIKDGYYSNSRFSFQNLSNSSYIEVVLANKLPFGKFQSSDGKVLPLEASAQVEFTPNSIVDANNLAYNGIVVVYNTTYDPTNITSLNLIPGDSRAQDKDGNAKLLDSYGMVQVDLETINKDKLNIASGQTAKITIPIPDSKKATAPATIPLWHFNESNGYWVEEGQAVLVGDKYEANVSHFSFWNAAIGSGFVRLTGTIIDQSANPLSSIKVKVTSNSNGVGIAYTDNQGIFSGYVPNKDPLTLNIDNCGNLSNPKSLGTLTSDTDLGKLSVNISNPVTIKGNLEDCSNQKLQQGIVYFYDKNYVFLGTAFTDFGGNFQFSFSNCNNLNNLVAIGYNYQIPQKSAPVDVILSASLNILPSTISVCDGANEYLSVNINGNTNYFTSGFSLTHQGDHYVLSLENDFINKFTIEFDKIGNNGDMTKLSALIYDGAVVTPNSSRLECTFCADQSVCGCSENDKLIFKSFGQSTGDYCEATLKGTIAKKKEPVKNYYINFKVKRDN